jgi:hypothetical protein
MILHRLARLAPYLVAAALAVQPASGVPGIPDQVPGASLLVPFFEVGIDIEANSHDTLLVVQNIAAFPVTVHWTVWTPQGNEATSMSGSLTLAGADTWSQSMRDLINQSSTPADRTALTRGDYFRGFLTIDVVEESTTLNPFASVYPFSSLDALEGFIYYTRLGEGSANGLRMLPLEAVSGDEEFQLRGFYAASENVDARERIDPRARLCAATLASAADVSECVDAFDGTIHRLHGRGFLSPVLNGESRFVVFAWNTFRPSEGGPSAVCDAHPPLDCESTYTLRRFDESGNLVEELQVRLDDVFSIFEFSGGTEGGIISIRDLPDPDRALQIFTFAFNSAKPAGLGQNWDAIFEGVVIP